MSITRRLLPTLAAVAMLAVCVDLSTAAEGRRHKKDKPASEPATAPSTDDQPKNKVLSIRGVVRKGSDPVAGVTVTVNKADPPASATTDDKGQFAIYDLAPGTYTLTADTGDRSRSTTSVHIEQGKVADVVMVVRGRVRDDRVGRIATPGHTPGRVATPR